MSSASRRRLARIVREPACDLAEAALLCCVELQPETDVDAELGRVDALAEGLDATDLRRGTPRDNAAALGAHLAGEVGFTGDSRDYHHPRNGLLTRVLDRRRGLPITLSIVYIAVGHRLDLPVFGIGLPGHFVTGVGGGDRPVVLDPFHDGRILGESELAERVRQATDGRLAFNRSMLRPSAPDTVIRRVLNNLTRDFVNRGDPADALWTVELKQCLPNRVPDDHRVRGELLNTLGRFREAAEAYEAYVEEVGEDAPDRDEVAHLAVRARARLN